MLQVKLPVVDRSNKFVMGVDIKDTGDLKPNGSLTWLVCRLDFFPLTYHRNGAFSFFKLN